MLYHRAHFEVLFKRLNILNIYDLCRLQILIFVYNPAITFSHPNTQFTLLALSKSIPTQHVALYVCNLYIINAKKPVVLMHLSQKLQGIGIHYLSK